MAKKDKNSSTRRSPPESQPTVKKKLPSKRVPLILAQQPQAELPLITPPGNSVKLNVNYSRDIETALTAHSYVVLSHMEQYADDGTPIPHLVGTLHYIPSVTRSGNSLTLELDPGARVKLVDPRMRPIFTTSWEIIPDVNPSEEEFGSPEFQELLAKLKQAILALPISTVTGKLPDMLNVDALTHESVGRTIDKWIYLFRPFVGVREVLDYLRLILAEGRVDIRIILFAELIQYATANKDKLINSLKAGPTRKSEDSHEDRYEEIKDHLPEEARHEIEREIVNIKRMPAQSPERAHLERWLDFTLGMPWGTTKEDEHDIPEVGRILKENHWGLDRIEARILRYIAAYRRNPKKRGPKIGFFGPPGVGKTSLGQAIAKALGRPFVRISLGGVKDEAVIRGHQRTYMSALVGEIAKGLRRAGAMNPVFMIDEVDKIGRDGIRGDPESALLEVLDPEQNYAFRDFYLGIPLDLSRVLFVLTGNVHGKVTGPLRDRIEAIHLPGYTDRDKLEIAKRHLLPQLLEENGLTAEKLAAENIPAINIADEAILRLIETTDEAGVRKLREHLNEMCETVARKIAEDQRPSSENAFWEITTDNLAQFISRETLRGKEDDSDLTELDPGIAIGLAVTDHGGDLMIVEATYRKNPKLELHITGHLDQIEPEAQTIKDSAKVALDRLTHNGGILEGADLRKRIGINFANGNVPKAGPSAGVTLYTALYSMLTNQQVKPGLAMTGEIRKKRRNIKGVGGIRDKVLAAVRKKMKEVIIPYSNREDVEDIHPDDRARVTIHFVRTPEEALLIAFPDDTRIAEYIEQKQRSS